MKFRGALLKQALTVQSTLAQLQRRLPEGVLLELAEVEDAVDALWPEEQALVAKAVESRRQEFSSARVLAHHLLHKLKVPSAPLLSLADRSPAWPTEILGSLSHSRKRCAALVACKTKSLLGLGVDVEDLRPLKQNLFAEILTAKEIETMEAALPVEQHATHVLAVFGIKEAMFKAMHALGNHGLGFHAMEVDVLNDGSRPRVLPLADLQQRLPRGCLPQVHHLREDEILLSVALLEGPASPTS